VRKAGARIYPTNEAFAQGLKTEEIDVGIMWKARTVQWQNADINVQSAVPAEGALAYVSGFSIPKNAPNEEGAYAYLDAMLEPSAQENFAVDMGYNPTVTDAEVPPELNERIGFTDEEIKNLVDLDYAYMTENDVALKEWWDKEFKG
jgi:putative spermidine/putrescine transport system substrate-binding protein